MTHTPMHLFSTRGRASRSIQVTSALRSFNGLATTCVLITSLLFDCAASAQSLPNTIQEQVTSASTVQDTVDVQHVMEAFHDAVVSHDGARLSALFIPDGSTWLNVLTDEAYAQAKRKKSDIAKVRVSNYKDFAKFVSSSKVSLEPKHFNLQTHSDGTIAAVYFDFLFLINGKLENQGSETWQLVKGSEGWRIAAITYSSAPHVQ
jgi:hypothetical protein